VHTRCIVRFGEDHGQRATTDLLPRSESRLAADVREHVADHLRRRSLGGGPPVRSRGILPYIAVIRPIWYGEGGDTKLEAGEVGLPGRDVTGLVDDHSGLPSRHLIRGLVSGERHNTRVDASVLLHRQDELDRFAVSVTGVVVDTLAEVERPASRTRQAREQVDRDVP